MKVEVQAAITVINQGGIVIFPTDTAFGIGCRIDKPESVARLFQIRKRPHTSPTPVLVSSEGMAHTYLQPLSHSVEKLMHTYWPGGLTIVYPSREELVPLLVRASGHTIGVRLPDHPITQMLIYKAGVPILGPSANFHGNPTPYTHKDLDPQLVKLVDYVVPGECTIKQASTVLDCSTTPWKIIRQGNVEIDVSLFRELKA